MAQYEDLVEKVGAFGADVAARRAPDLACARGCDACCHVELTVSPTEARRVAAYLADLEGVDVARRRAIAARADVPSTRCVMLDADGACDVYPARPLVCRTQGLPLGYPAGVVPEATVRFRVRALEVVCCPLNFTAQEPAPADVLDAGRVDAMHALVARLEGDDATERVALRTLARGR